MRIPGRHQLFRGIFLLAASCLAAGCSHKQLSSGFQISVPAAYPPTASAEIPLAIGDVLQVEFFRSYDSNGPYRLGVGDQIEVLLRAEQAVRSYRLSAEDEIEIVVKAGVDGGDYRLQVGDGVRLMVPTREDLSVSTTILPDGTAVMPSAGAVALRGLSLAEAVNRLERTYARYLDSPKLDLLVTDVAKTEIRESVNILPDGSGTLPLIGTVPLRGRTVADLVEDLSQQYEAFFFDPQVDLLVSRSSEPRRYEATVLPDGRTTLPLIGAVTIEGLTVEEAVAKITDEYSAYLTEPAVDILITDSGWRVKDFFATLRETPSGSTRDATVTDDGLIRLPLIEPIPAASRTFSEVSEDIASSYSAVLPEVEVSTVFALGRSQRKVSVLGEVVRPGMFDTIQPISALQALALAGGFSDRAWRSQVLLLHPDFKERTLSVRVLDMKKGLRMGDPTLLATTVRSQDIVYVPRKPISDVNLFVQQYIATMIPFELRVDVQASQ